MLLENFLVPLPIFAVLLSSSVIKDHEPDVRIDGQLLRLFHYIFHESVIAIGWEQFY